MKKVILLIAVLCSALTMSAQDVSDNLSYDHTFSYYTGQADDTVGPNVSEWTFDVQKKNQWKVFPYVYIETSDGPNIAPDSSSDVKFDLQSKTTESESYTSAKSATWTLSTSDTTIALQPTSSSADEYWRLKVTPVTDTSGAEIDVVEWKFVND